MQRFHEHITVLASPYFEGRGLDTQGIERAAEYIEFHLQAFGLDPAFDSTISVAGSDGERVEVIAPGSSYRQAVAHSSDTVTALDGFMLSTAGGPSEALPAGDAAVLALSGQGSVTGTPVFVGYSITIGPGGYINYPGVNNLEGRIAIVLDLEPMEDGLSRWTRSGWSENALPSRKISAAIRRNAAAVLVVTPPGLDSSTEDWIEVQDERMGELNAFEDVPVVRVSPAAIDRIVRAGDADGRSLNELIALANAEPTVIDLDAATVTVEVMARKRDVTTDNLGAMLPGSGVLSDELVIIGAHYDHLGYGTHSTRSPELVGSVHPGADDNGSGTAALLVLAERLSERYRTMPSDVDRRSVLFLWFTAEERGLIGSKHYVEHPVRPIAEHAVMLNMDMMGRMVDDRLFVAGLDRSEGMEAMFTPALDASGLHIIRELNIGWDRSDHASFDAMGVPALFFFTGLHDDYHTAMDTSERINRTGTGEIIELVEAMTLAAATSPTRLGAPASARRGVTSAREGISRVVTGLTPTAASNGVRVRRVRAETPAGRAGLEPGDLIRAWNGETIGSLNEYAGALRSAEPGDTVTLTIDRAGEVIEVEMVLEEE